MPWRKRYDFSLSMEEKGQRAYEVDINDFWNLLSLTLHLDMGCDRYSRQLNETDSSVQSARSCSSRLR